MKNSSKWNDTATTHWNYGVQAPQWKVKHKAGFLTLSYGLFAVLHKDKAFVDNLTSPFLTWIS